MREGDWKVAPLPADLQDRRVEITGPTDRKMVINALNRCACLTACTHACVGWCAWVSRGWRWWRMAARCPLAPPPYTLRPPHVHPPHPSAPSHPPKQRSGANVYMPDFEDSNCPTWDNMVGGQANLHAAVRRTISLTAPGGGKTYRLNPQVAVMLVRPRG